MTDEKVKEAVEWLEGALADPAPLWREDTLVPELGNVSFGHLRAILAHCDALQAERDKLAAEVERLKGDVRQLKHALPDCHICGGHGTIEHAAKTTGANQHSACVERCDNCDGLGVEL